MQRRTILTTLLFASVFSAPAVAQLPLLGTQCSTAVPSLLIAGNGKALPIYVAPQDAETLELVADAFAGDVERVTGLRPRIVHALDGESEAILLGTVNHSPAIDALSASLHLDSLRGKWESAITAVLDHPSPTLKHAVVIAGSDRRGAAYALFALSREMGVSPWAWWADVPVAHRDALCMDYGTSLQSEPSVQYRGIFLNDEDWGLRPWAAKKMDPELGNIGPHTYRQVFELLLRLRANVLWPAMHPGTLPFNAVAENARLADRWGIVMGSSHSEAMLRNNVGEWDERRDGPWNYQTNRQAIDAYWKRRVLENGKYENFYTIGMRGLHDTGLEVEGTATEKARLVEEVMASQRSLLTAHVNPQLEEVLQVIWLYKESLELYRAGMKVPGDVTLGWTDDNYGYLRQLPTADEQKRAGGSAVYYHVSYWGFPHDYLWLCTTPPALIREEMSKAFDHGARRLWVLNVGDLKPAESDIDYFMQLAWNEPGLANVSQTEFLRRWFGEQFGAALAPQLAGIMNEYYHLNFIRKPEFMGFNGYNDTTNRTDFNPLAWDDQNRERINSWQQLSGRVDALMPEIPEASRAAFFELVAYPVQAAAAQNEKFLWADRTYLDAMQRQDSKMLKDNTNARDAYARIHELTRDYNRLQAGKWDGMMDDAPRARQVFYLPVTGIDTFLTSRALPLPPSWKAPTAGNVVAPCAKSATANTAFREEYATVSINAAHFARKSDTDNSSRASWRVLDDLGISGASLVFGSPGRPDARMAAFSDLDHLASAPWVEYDFNTLSLQEATLTIHLLPVFPIDSQHRLRFAYSLDGGAPRVLKGSGVGEWKEGSAPTWEANVLRNAAQVSQSLGALQPGPHTLRLVYVDPGVVFQHLTVAFPGAPPAYPVPPETRCAQ